MDDRYINMQKLHWNTDTGEYERYAGEIEEEIEINTRRMTKNRSSRNLLHRKAQQRYKPIFDAENSKVDEVIAFHRDRKYL